MVLWQGHSVHQIMLDQALRILPSSIEFPTVTFEIGSALRLLASAWNEGMAQVISVIAPIHCGHIKQIHHRNLQSF